MVVEWRVVPDTDGYLEVSNEGQVRSKSYSIIDKRGVTQTFKAINKKLTLGNNGYYHFRFRGKPYLVHRCVALCFVDGYSETNNIVNHKDGVKLNNYWKNLEWGTCATNNDHAIKTGLRDYSKHNNEKGEDRFNSKLTENDVRNIMKLLQDKSVTQRSIAKKFNVSDTVIYNIKIGKTWKHVLEGV